MSARGAKGTGAGRAPRGSGTGAGGGRRGKGNNRVAFEGDGSVGGGSMGSGQYYDDEQQQYDEYGNPLPAEDYDDGQGGSMVDDERPLHPAVRVDEQGNLTVPPEVFLDDLPELPIAGGYVQKKDGKATGLLGSRPWKKVFLRLEGLDLVFYDRAPPDAGDGYDDDPRQPAAKELRVFNITKDTFIDVGDENASHKNKSVRFTFSMFNEPEGTVHKEEDVVHVAVDTAEDREDWMFAVNYVVEKILDAEAILENPYMMPAGAGGNGSVNGSQVTGEYYEGGVGMGGSQAGSDGAGGYYDGSQYGSDAGGGAGGTGGSEDFYAPPEVLASVGASAGGARGGGGIKNGPFSLKGASAGAKAAAVRAVAAAAANLAANEAAAEANAAILAATAGSGKGRVIDDPEERQIVADEAQCHTAHGPGLYEAVRGEPTHFVVQANDVTGVEKTYGGDPFTAAIVSEDMQMDLAVADNEDGTYTVTYTPTRSGECELQVLYAGANIYGSPFHLTVAKAPTAPNHCVVSGEATVVARPGQLNTFTITTRDQFDDERGQGGDNFIITVAGGGKAHPILDMGNGTYTVTYEVDTEHRAYQAALAQAPIVAAGGPVPLMALEVHVSLMNEGFAYARPVSGSPYRPKVVIPEIQAALQQAGITLHTQGTLPQLTNGALPSTPSAAAHTMSRTGGLASATSRTPAAVETPAAASTMPFFSNSLPANLAAAMQTLSMANSPSHNNNSNSSTSAAQADKAAELAAKELRVEAGLQAIEEMRRRLEADRSAVDRQMARMQELGMKVREDSERLAEQARTLRSLALASSSSSNANAASGSPVASKNVFTAPGAAVQAVDEGAFPFHSRSPQAPSSAPAGGLSSELFDPEVVGLFEKYKKPLLALWSFYSSLSSPSLGGGADVGVDCKRFLELFADYDIAPTFITRRELKSIFVAAARANGTLQSAGASSPGGTSEAAGASGASSEIRGHLTYAGIIEALGRAALASLSKPAFANLYPTARDRVLVLLEMWGVADARKLSEVQRRPRKGMAATGDLAPAGIMA